MAHGRPRNPAPAQTQDDRTREMAARRTAARRGYRAAKIRRYDATAPDWNTWLVRDARGRLVPELARTVNGVLIGASLDELEKFLGITPPETAGEQPGA